MPMPLVVEDGTGLANADSYVSLAQADAYHITLGNTGWAGTNELKEQALRRATRYIDFFYYDRWSGVRLNGRDQALQWPRIDAVDIDNEEILEDEVPIE